MSLRIFHHPTNDHFNRREVTDAYARNELHIVCPACTGRANYAVALSLEHPQRTPEIREEAMRLAEQATSHQTPVTLLPNLPLSALPMNRGYFSGGGHTPPNEETIDQWIEEIFRHHCQWVRQKSEQEEKPQELPPISFFLDQSPGFPVKETVRRLRNFERHPEPLAKIFEEELEKHLILPHIELRSSTMP